MVVSVVALLVSLWAAWAASSTRRVPSWHGRDAESDATRPVPSRRARSRHRTKQPHFTFEQLSPHRYALRNDGNGTAYDVRLDTGELSVHEGSLTVDKFPPRHAEEYLLIQPLQNQVSQVDVTWYTSRDALAEAHVTPLPLGPRPVEIDHDPGST